MTILVRTSERMTFTTCRQKWYWSWVENLKPLEEDVKLKFGGLVHQALAIYYKPGRKRGPLPAETFEHLAAATLDPHTRIWSDDEIEDLVDLGVRMLEGYVEKWKSADSEYSIISSEQVFHVPIGHVLGERIVAVGTVDGVWRHLPTGKIRFAEHKTAASISHDMLPMDEQIGSYWAFAPKWLQKNGVLKAGEQIDGILMNWLRKAAPDMSKARDAQGHILNKDGSVSKRQPPPYFDRKNTFRGSVEAARVRLRTKQQARDMIMARKDPLRYVYKNPGPQFMPNCKFCSFRDPCELHETGHDYQTMFDAGYKVWDPYAEHELPERL